MSADGLFARATSSMQRARSGSVEREATISDNKQLWMTVLGMLRDPDNQLPVAARTSLISLARSAQHELAKTTPDFTFLIAINDAVSSGLETHP